jgi:hypothetical protein
MAREPNYCFAGKLWTLLRAADGLLAFLVERKANKWKHTWFKKFSKVIPAKKAAQFIQLENQLNAASDLRPATLALIE